MPLNYMQHFLVQAEDVEATRDWYVDVLGMTVGYTPDFKFPVYWLYLGEQDVLHLTKGGANVSENRLKYLGQQAQDAQGTGVIDHIAFRATGLDEVIEHFNKRGVDFKERQVSADGFYQLFLFDPNGIKIELNFLAEEANGRVPQVLASDLHEEIASQQ